MMQRFRDALAQLDLTDDQKKKTDDVLSDMTAQVKQMRQSVQAGTMSREDVRDKLATLVLDTRSKISSILTPDQQQKLRSIMQQGASAPNTPRPNRRNNNSPPAMPPTTAPALSDSAAPKANETSLVPTTAPDVGQPAPDFQLRLLNGDTTSLSEAKHKILVLTFASATAPVFRDHAAGLNTLHEKYGSRGVQFLVIYTKEQHPAGGWELQRNKDDNINIPLAKTPADRATAAEQLHNALHLSVPIATDTLSDQTAAAYGVNQTVPAFVIDRDGNVVFHQSWLEPDSLGRAIDDALAAEKK
jgi:glutathione peroxidase-family protein